MRAKDFTKKSDQEADYGPAYQAMVQRVGQKARAQQKQKPVDIADLARRLKSVKVDEAPGAETLAHNQSTVASNEKAFDLEEYTDPELAKTLAYAGVHYPNYKKKPEAFMKWASRAIMHSEEQDTKHNSQFAEIHHELDQIKQIVAKISNRWT